MPFSDADRRAIYDRSSGRCECSRQHDGIEAPHHGGRCDVRFTFSSGSGLTDWWEPVQMQSEASGGAFTQDNAEALCGACYKIAR
jgi:hypothetical protein